MSWLEYSAAEFSRYWGRIRLLSWLFSSVLTIRSSLDKWNALYHKYITLLLYTCKKPTMKIPRSRKFDAAKYQQVSKEPRRVHQVSESAAWNRATDQKNERIVWQTQERALLRPSWFRHHLIRELCLWADHLSDQQWPTIFAIVISRCSNGCYQTVVFSTDRSCAEGTGSVRWSNHQSNQPGRTWHRADTPLVDEWHWISRPTYPCWHLPS
jgi:hypothetical protein